MSFVVFVCSGVTEPGEEVNAAAELGGEGEEVECTFAFVFSVVVVGLALLSVLRRDAILRYRESVGKVGLPRWPHHCIDFDCVKVSAANYSDRVVY